VKAFKKRYKTSRPVPPLPPRRRWRLLVTVAATLLAIGGGLLFWGQSSGKTGIPIQVSGAPRVAVAQESVDHGDLKFDTSVSTIFQVSNIGDKPLQILGEPRVELVEGC
jgi:hypothetical protein